MLWPWSGDSFHVWRRVGHNTTQQLIRIVEGGLGGRKLFGNLTSDLLFSEVSVATPDNGQTPGMNQSSNQVADELAAIIGPIFGVGRAINVQEVGAKLKKDT